jgi:hypothetical protein
MGQTREEMIGFWGMTDYPEERVFSDFRGQARFPTAHPEHDANRLAKRQART